MTGGELKARRLALGLSLRKLAAELEVSFQTIDNWERGQLTIEHGKLLDLALQTLERTHAARR